AGPDAPNFASTGTRLGGSIGINVLLQAPVTSEQLAELNSIGTVRDQMPEINALTMQIKSGNLAVVQALPYVVAANPDAERNAKPIDAVSLADFAGGLSTWDQDAVNVTVQPFSASRAVAYDGSGVYVGVLDTGLLPTWQQYLPQERIAVQYARAFGGGGGNVGNVSSQPNKWEDDVNAHGTHVTSTIIGYQFGATPINGTAPKATIIPVKVLNQNGSGWSSVIARGIVYIADLKAGPLSGSPMVVNMSLGGPTLDALEAAAINYAVGKGVIIVASAGNSGTRGMGYPGGYQPVISVAASGWIGEWKLCATSTVNPGSFWVRCDVAEPTNPGDFYITDFSSRELPGQDLDVAAPGSWVVGPYQLNQGKTNYFFLGGTSQASPHVAGIVALMAQKKPDLTAPEAETILETTAIPLPPGSRSVRQPDGSTVVESWGADATGAGLATADAALAGTP
ncbi:MAG: S8 family peptidase, partial [Gemmatimonadales bacterium]